MHASFQMTQSVCGIKEMKRWFFFPIWFHLTPTKLGSPACRAKLFLIGYCRSRSIGPSFTSILAGTVWAVAGDMRRDLRKNLTQGFFLLLRLCVNITNFLVMNCLLSRNFIGSTGVLIIENVSLANSFASPCEHMHSWIHSSDVGIRRIRLKQVFV
jgi:hypothetical protein